MKFKSRTKSISNRSVLFGGVAGILTALIIGLLLLTGLSSVLIKGTIKESAVGILLHIIRAIATLVGVLIGTGLVKEKIVVTSGAITLGYLLILLCLGVVIYDTSFRSFVQSAMSVAFGGTAACMFRLKLHNKPIRMKKMR